MTHSAPYLDTSSKIVALITLILFVIALFLKGLSHDLLLEAGVFLVSVKLMMMAYKSSATTRELIGRMEELRAMVARLDRDNRSEKRI